MNPTRANDIADEIHRAEYALWQRVKASGRPFSQLQAAEAVAALYRYIIRAYDHARQENHNANA